MRSLFLLLLRLYPANYYDKYAEEMAWVFFQSEEAVRLQGAGAYARFWIREMFGILKGALQARLLYRDWNLFGRFDMSKQFRFPRSTIFLMLLVFVGVILAIDSAVKVASARDTSSLSLKLAFAIVPIYLLVGSLGVIGFAILFALRRSGVHRLSGVQAWLKKG